MVYKAVFEHGRKHLARVGVTSEKEFKKIIHAEAMRHNRELQTKQDEARESASKSNTKRGENGIMHSMKNRAKPALAIALAIVGAVAAPLRSDAAELVATSGGPRFATAAKMSVEIIHGLLISVENEEARAYYLEEARKSLWSVRERTQSKTQILSRNWTLARSAAK